MTCYVNNAQPASNQYSINTENQQTFIPAAPFQSSSNKVSAIILDSDQSIIKGTLWAFAAFKLGSTTCALAAGTLLSAVVLPPLAIPVGLTTYFFGCLTSTCLQNTSYHLAGSHKVIILQNQ